MNTPPPDPDPQALLAEANRALAEGREQAALAKLHAAVDTGRAPIDAFHALAMIHLRRQQPAIAARWFLAAPASLVQPPEWELARAQALVGSRMHDELERLAERIEAQPQLAVFAQGLRAHVAVAEDRLETALAMLGDARVRAPSDLNLLFLAIQCMARLGRESELLTLVDEGLRAVRSLGQPALTAHLWAQVRQTEFSQSMCTKDRLYIAEGAVLLGTSTDDGIRIEALRALRFDVPSLARTLFRFAQLREALGWRLDSIEPADEGSRPLCEAAARVWNVPVRGPLPGEDPAGAWWIQDQVSAARKPRRPTSRPRFALLLKGDGHGESAIPEVIGVVAADGGSFPWNRSYRGPMSPLWFHLPEEAVLAEPEQDRAEFLAELEERYRRLVPEPNQNEQIAYYGHRHRRLRERIEVRQRPPLAEGPVHADPLAHLLETEPVPLAMALRHLWSLPELSPPVLERLESLFARVPQLRSSVLPVLERFAPRRALEAVLALPDDDATTPGPTRGDYLAALRSPAALPHLHQDLLAHPRPRRLGIVFPDFRLGSFLHRDELPELLERLSREPGGELTVLAFAAGIPPREGPGLGPLVDRLVGHALLRADTAGSLAAALGACLAGWRTVSETELGPLLDHEHAEIRDRALRLLLQDQAPGLCVQTQARILAGELGWSPPAAGLLLHGTPHIDAFCARVRVDGTPQGTPVEGGYLRCIPGDGQREALLRTLCARLDGEQYLAELLLPALHGEVNANLLRRWLPRLRGFLSAEAALAVVRWLVVHGNDSAEERALLRHCMGGGGLARGEAAALLLARGEERYQETLTTPIPGRTREETPGVECFAALDARWIEALGDGLLRTLETETDEAMSQRLLMAINGNSQDQDNAFAEMLLGAIGASGFRSRFLDHMQRFYLRNPGSPFPEGIVATFGLAQGIESPSLKIFYRLAPERGREAARQRFRMTTAVEREAMLRTLWRLDRELYVELLARVEPGSDRVLECLQRSLLVNQQS